MCNAFKQSYGIKTKHSAVGSSVLDADTALSVWDTQLHITSPSNYHTSRATNKMEQQCTGVILWTFWSLQQADNACYCWLTPKLLTKWHKYISLVLCADYQHCKLWTACQWLPLSITIHSVRFAAIHARLHMPRWPCWVELHSHTCTPMHTCTHTLTNGGRVKLVPWQRASVNSIQTEKWLACDSSVLVAGIHVIS